MDITEKRALQIAQETVKDILEHAESLTGMGSRKKLRILLGHMQNVHIQIGQYNDKHHPTIH